MIEMKATKVLDRAYMGGVSIVTDSMKYSVTKQQVTPRRKKTQEYDELASTMKTLPEGKAVRITVPTGELAARVRTKLYNVLKARGVPVSIVSLSENELELSRAS